MNMAQQYFRSLISCDYFFRKKKIDLNDVGETKLARVLNTIDLTALGIGSTLGAGIYVLAGAVIKQTTGPSVILSFLIAAIASIFAGLCYAEFGARVPKTGSAYVYTYVTIGEFLAFVIGWNLILEYIIGTSSVARAFSTYFDSLVNKSIQKFFRYHMPINVEGLSPYPDFFAFGITLVITAVLALGVKESSRMNNIFTTVNLCVVTFIIVCGSFKADLHNWNIPANELPVNNQTLYPNGTCNTTETCGAGGFTPFGVAGILAGAAKCFYAFVGFDCIATTGEEVRNPQKAIPVSIVLSLLICAVSYCGVSSVLSMMMPYFLVDADAPMPEAFRYVGWNWARYLVAIGAICSLSTSLLGAMFPLPRVLYAISSDGLIFKFFSTISPKFKTPLIATILSGIFAGFMAMIFDLEELVNMMSIGTLLAYSLVAVSVLILRYQHESNSTSKSLLHSGPEDEGSLIKRLFNPIKYPTEQTAKLVNYLTFICTVNIIIICLILILGTEFFTLVAFVILLSFSTTTALFLVFVIYRQPQNTKSITFKMPLVPVLPLLSIFVNVYLMLVLNSATWIRFAIWMLIGFAIYFGYGMTHSLESARNKPSVLVVNQAATSDSSASDTEIGAVNPAYDSKGSSSS